jgi:hypothetical protein
VAPAGKQIVHNEEARHALMRRVRKLVDVADRSSSHLGPDLVQLGDARRPQINL